MPDLLHENRVGRRHDRRQQICAAGTYRTGCGTARNVQLTDLSLTGCRFMDASNRLHVGTRLTVKIAEVGPFDALVSWMDGSSVGLRFVDALYPPYFEKLAEDWPPAPKQFERRVNRRG